MRQQQRNNKLATRKLKPMTRSSRRKMRKIRPAMLNNKLKMRKIKPCARSGSSRTRVYVLTGFIAQGPTSFSWMMVSPLAIA